MHRVAFRREVHLTDLPQVLPIRLSADSRYVLWVNGREIGRGPVRGQPYRWTYDEYDLAPHVVAGTNTIAVLVTYYGADNAMWQRAAVLGGLGADACLILDAPEGFRQFVTGEGWLARTMPEWSTVSGEGLFAALPIEVIDQREHQESWMRAGSDEGFAPALVAEATHPGSFRRSRPPAYPYGALRPRGIAHLDGDTVGAAIATVGRPGPQLQREPVETVHHALKAVSDWSEEGAVHMAGPADPVLSQFDFGRVVSGFVELDFEVPAGTVLDLAYLERPFDPERDVRYVPRAGARVIAAGGAGSFRALETNGLRVVAVLVTPPEGLGAVAIECVRVREHLYPFTGGATYASSDSELEGLWRAGVRTVQLNSSDAFTDCPTREQRAWVGDAVVHLGVHLVANEDWRLAERHLELCDSPRPDGLLPMSVAGDIEASSRHSIPDWSLHWLHSLWTYARASQHVEFVRQRLPTAERILAWFRQYAGTDGLLTDVPEWTIIDWSSVFATGESSILTALWVRGLNEFADLSEWLGNEGAARHARSLAARAGAGFESFWDGARGLYVDHIVDGERMPAVSQAANAAAIVAGLVPPERTGEVVERMTDETLLVTRGWNTASSSIPLEQKVRDRAEGVRRIDWDVQREIVRAEPFFSSVVHDAVALAGHAELLPLMLRRWSRFLEDGYDTFGECWEWGTPAHGWSSTPTRDLVVHVLGVEPVGLGTDAYRVAPVRSEARWTRAHVPTRRGLLRVELDEEWVSVTGPVPIQVTTWNGEKLDFPAGDCRVNLATGETHTKTIEPQSIGSG